MKVLTPHLDAFAVREGTVAIEKAYCISALCTPSRLSVLTGRYLSAIYDDKEAVGTGDLVASIEFFGGPQADTFEEMKGLPKVIKQAGYMTAFYGKWHMELDEMTARFALEACHAYMTANMTAELTHRLAEVHRLNMFKSDAWGRQRGVDYDWGRPAYLRLLRLPLRGGNPS